MVEAIVLGILALCFILVAYVSWDSKRDARLKSFSSCLQPDYRTTKISFDNFIQWYSVAPEKWSCCQDSLQHSSRTKDGLIVIPIKFEKISDLNKYLKWHANREDEKRALEENEKKVVLLQEVQRDIEEYKKKNMGR